jgi:hypothetical protein
MEKKAISMIELQDDLGCGLEAINITSDSAGLCERRAHAPQLAGAEVTHGVEVEVTENHRKETASWGCHVAACWASFMMRLMSLLA